ncbi:MAG: TlpA family protein disulfide reductase [Planctomycetaceae bacterium]|nr:TlpA family protein disulfide reductase [Planctomycetaceae bacterium]
MLLLQFQLQNDLQKANESDKEAAAEGFLKTYALANEVLSDEELTDPRLGKIRQLVDFNRVRAIALSGDVAETAAALAAAYDSGFEQYRGLDKDPFFTSIADHPEIQKVIAENADRLRAKYRESAREEFAKAEDVEFNFDLPDLEGKSVKLSDFAGKVVIVDLWGTWCPPCRMEIPHFIELQDKFKDDLEVVGITYEQVSDEQAAIKQISEFVKAEGVNYPCVIGDEATQNALEVRGFPTTVFIDREGKVRLKIVGYHPYEKLEGYVAELIEEGKPSS